MNYQYGQFSIVAESLGIREAANKPIDKPYAEVARIQAWVTAAHTPKPEGDPSQRPAKPCKTTRVSLSQ